MSEKGKKIGLKIIETILILVIIVCLIIIIRYLWQRKRADSLYEDIASQMARAGGESIESGEKMQAGRLDYRAMMASLKAMNPEVVGYILIDGSDNQYPVFQARDNEKYLRRDIKLERSVQGSPFMDCANAADLSDQNTVVYAHMMDYGDAMFGIFRHYYEQDYVDRSPKTFHYINGEGIRTYRIFSLRRVDAAEKYRIPNMEEGQFAAFLQRIQQESEVDFRYEGELGGQSSVMTLSTCTMDHNRDYRTAVVGVLVDLKK